MLLGLGLQRLSPLFVAVSTAGHGDRTWELIYGAVVCLTHHRLLQQRLSQNRVTRSFDIKRCFDQ